MVKIALKELTIDQLRIFIQNIGEEKFRTDQRLYWIYKKNAASFEEMTNISKPLRAKLSEIIKIDLFKNINTLKSKDKSIKFVITLEDNYKIESVLIPEMKKNTLCISTQVGCKFACKICRTGLMGFKRNLTSGEIVEQIITAKRYAQDNRISNLVFMGMGEPLHNYNNLKKALSIIIHKKALDFSPRYITVSTAGFIPNMLNLGKDFPNIGLALSLNAVDNKTRNNIMPINKIYSIEKLISTLKKYPLKPRKVITIEYVLLNNINDSVEDALTLAKILKKIRCKINLIKFNEFDSSKFKSPKPKKIENFRIALINNGYTCITRKSRGQDIHAACGCLASP